MKGYKRCKVIGAIYPAILKGDAKDETSGVLLKGLSSQDITRLDQYEGDVSGIVYLLPFFNTK